MSETSLAFIKLFATFGVILLLLRLHFSLWKTIAAGCVCMALLTGLPLRNWVNIPLQTFAQSDFIIMQVMLFGILVLSGIQAASGQNQRLVDGLERYVRWPRIRLVLFPSLVGLLPMPGGALFSCPMLDAAAHGMNLSPKRKALINYWFRHIWEMAWPLYPGYILVCQLLHIPLLALLKYTIPLVVCAFISGWFFYMRGINTDNIPEPGTMEDMHFSHHPLLSVVYEAAPMLITILGAAICGLILNNIAPDLPSQVAFMISLTLGIATALWQGRDKLGKSLMQIAFNKSTVNMFVLITCIYIFKNVIAESGIVAQLSHVGGSFAVVILLFIALPLICGMLTGIMVGYVGACFPILLGILLESSLQELTLPLVLLGIICGNIGQLLTPLHVCVVISCEYYHVKFVDLWRNLVPPLITQFCYGSLWVAIIYFAKWTI